MGFLLLEKPGEMCPDRQINVSAKFWNLNRGHMSDDELRSLNVPYVDFTLYTSGVEVVFPLK